jgi:2-oxoglutarate/2-oxoacid ferredoxin oxidoreductase subunit alpha
MPYQRDERLARPWALPGTPGLMHRIGGLEKQDITGNVSYDPDNHQHMVDTAARKVANIADRHSPQEVAGPETGELLVLSWGGTYGACATASTAPAAGGVVAHAHLRIPQPVPAEPGRVLAASSKVLIPELNMGQLRCCSAPSTWSTPWPEQGAGQAVQLVSVEKIAKSCAS